jgi:phage regulator Rha-like protein
MARAKPALVASEQVASRILVIRGEKVLLDADLAELYGISTGRFNEQVKRNLARFPADFMFQLTNQEVRNLRSQFATSSLPRAWGGRRYAPFAFTEHGAIMAATILNTSRATEVSVYVVRAFVQLRGLLATHKELAQRLDQLEARIEKKLASHDQAIVGILNAIRELMKPPETKKRPIGFVAPEENKKDG